MGSHPVNLGLRFVLEILALVALGYWGSRQGTGFVRVLLAIGIPIIVAVIWGTFAVPDDPSRSGDAPIAVAGWVRLIIEFAVFAGASLALHFAGRSVPAGVLAAVVIVHYALSYDRILWLINQ
jgi:hypothetical protein